MQVAQNFCILAAWAEWSGQCHISGLRHVALPAFDRAAARRTVVAATTRLPVLGI